MPVVEDGGLTARFLAASFLPGARRGFCSLPTVLGDPCAGIAESVPGAGRATAALSSRLWRILEVAVTPSFPVGLCWALALLARLTVAAMAAANRTLFSFFMVSVLLWQGPACRFP